MERLSTGFKATVQEELISFVFGKQTDLLMDTLDDLITRNSLLWGNTETRLRYRGDVYWHTTSAANREISVNAVHSQILSEFENYLVDAKELMDEKFYVANYFSQVLNAGNRVSDYRKMLPECVHCVLEKFNSSNPNLSHTPEDEIEKVLFNNARSIETIKKHLLINLIK